MPYIESKWGRIGLELGEAQERYRRDKAFREDKAKAMAQAQQDLEASRELGDVQLQDLEKEEASQVTGGAPFDPERFQGAYTAEEQRVHERFARTRAVAQNLSPENRARWIEEERVRMQQGAIDRARQKVAEGVQDRYAHGGFNLLDETEPNPAIESRVQQLMEALDSDQIDPIAAAETEAKILEAVRTENQRRLERKRGTAMIEKRLQSAIDGGNPQLAKDYETLHAMWGTGELKADDLVDAMFEAEHGRKTARAAGPTPYDIRKEALRLWQQSPEGQFSKTPPTAAQLAPYIELLDPTPPEQPPTRGQVLTAANTGGAGGTEGDFQGRGQAPPSAPVAAGAPETQGPPLPPKKPGKPWKGLPKAEQTKLEKRLLSVAGRGATLKDLQRILGGIDIESLPKTLQTRLLEKVTASGHEKRVETVKSTMGMALP